MSNSLDAEQGASNAATSPFERGSHVTRRWRKPDSNRRYRVTQARFREGLMSPPLDSSLTENSARTRTDTRTTTGAFRGTDASNPLPSSGESGTNSVIGSTLYHEPAARRLGVS